MRPGDTIRGMSTDHDHGSPWSADAARFRTENLENWSERALLHARSADYGIDALVDDPARISDVVRFDVPRLGDVAGLRVLHLQCHIGTDTISLARLGAQVTGVDFSAAAIAEGRKLASRCGVDVRFVEADAYDAARLVGANSFDLVYTGIGALCWLPRIRPWAATVAELLVPQGRLFLREGHPMLWALDENVTEALLIRYPYFETPRPVSIDDPDSYVRTERPMTASLSHSWNHGLGEIVSALLDEGMSLTMLAEHDSVPWDALPGQMVRDEVGEWRLREGPERLPLTYTLVATRGSTDSVAVEDHQIDLLG